MINDLRIYNYHDDSPLINRTTQVKEYLDKKLSNVQARVDLTEVKETIYESTNDIKETIEHSKPCLCHLATKEDVCKAKHAIIREIDEKFVDLNDLINNN